MISTSIFYLDNKVFCKLNTQNNLNLVHNYLSMNKQTTNKNQIEIGTIIKKPTYLINTFEVIEIINNNSYLGTKYIIKPLNEIGYNETLWQDDIEKNPESYIIMNEVLN